MAQLYLRLVQFSAKIRSKCHIIVYFQIERFPHWFPRVNSGCPRSKPISFFGDIFHISRQWPNCRIFAYYYNISYVPRSLFRLCKIPRCFMKCPVPSHNLCNYLERHKKSLELNQFVFKLKVFSDVHNLTGWFLDSYHENYQMVWGYILNTQGREMNLTS